MDYINTTLQTVEIKTIANLVFKAEAPQDAILSYSPLPFSLSAPPLLSRYLPLLVMIDK